MNPRFQATVEKGKLILDNIQRYKMYLYGLEGKKVSVVVKRWVKQRSKAENRYFHGVIVPLVMEDTGYSKEEAKDALKLKFLRVPSEGRDIDAFDTVKRSRDLTTVEWEQWMTEIREWASIERGYFIPEPNEVEWEI
ncbi:MAG: hypothetical protein KAS32_15085 [Candidatus Peribacteraceae bacterium]|nr:hypothetical protein [Candidatus Peribacteraceae bacterium]